MVQSHRKRSAWDRWFMGSRGIKVRVREGLDDRAVSRAWHRGETFRTDDGKQVTKHLAQRTKADVVFFVDAEGHCVHSISVESALDTRQRTEMLADDWMA